MFKATVTTNKVQFVLLENDTHQLEKKIVKIPFSFAMNLYFPLPPSKEKCFSKMNYRKKFLVVFILNLYTFYKLIWIGKQS